MPSSLVHCTQIFEFSCYVSHPSGQSSKRTLSVSSRARVEEFRSRSSGQHTYIYIGLKVRSICLLRGCSISFEWISELWVVVLLFWAVPISIEHRDKHIWVVKEKGGSSNVYISMHLPLLRVEGLGSKSSGRHTYTGAIQHDRVAHLAAVSKDMPSSVASSVKDLLHSEEITVTAQTEFNDVFSPSTNMQLSGCIIVV